MNHLIGIIDKYLKEKNTDYAIMITGDWGCGKTHFWKNTLTKRISRTPLPGIDKKLRYKPIYISLYGITKIEDIGREILAEYLPTLLNIKMKKLPGQVFKKVFASGSGLFKLDLEDISPDDFLKKIDLTGRVICFDDLERSELLIEEVLGYINSFVEHDKIKTIIISNEEEIMVKNESYYNRIKEKLVGVTMEFVPDYADVIEKIIEVYKETKEGLYYFLMEKKDQILKMFNLWYTQNIRILKHSLEFFSTVFSYLEAKHKDELVEIAEPVLLYTLAVSYEIKSGSADEEEIESLKRINSVLDLHLSIDVNKENKHNYIADFHERYSSKFDNFKFYPAVIDYILRSFLNVKHFEKEIEEDQEKTIEEKYKMLNIVVGEYWTLTDEKFNEYKIAVFEFAKNGEYKFVAYPRIFGQFLQFFYEDLLNIDKQTLITGLSNGMEKAYQSATFCEDDEYSIKNLCEYYHDYEEYKEFEEFFLKLNIKLRDKMGKIISENILSLLPDNVNEFAKSVMDYQSYNDEKLYMPNVPIFKDYEIKQLFYKLCGLTNPDIHKFIEVIADRYSAENAKEHLWEDLHTLEAVKVELDNYINENQNNNSLKFNLLKKLSTKLTEICNILR